MARDRFRGRSDRVPEAEIALDLAWHLLQHPENTGVAYVSIDGAQVQVAGRTIFRISEFLKSEGWRQLESTKRTAWNGVYGRHGLRLHVDSEPGKGDVRVPMRNQRIVAECKGGPVAMKRGNPEYSRLWQAIGQLATVKEVLPGDMLVVAVPRTPAFAQRADGFRTRPLIKRLGIQFVLVDEYGLYPPIP